MDLKLLTLVLFASNAVYAYRPVIMMHGSGSTRTEMDTIQKVLLERDNTTSVISLPLYEGQPGSWDVPLNTQVDGVISYVRNLTTSEPETYADGYHFVCKSQGALICRAVIQAMSDHKVINFVSLAGPQSGVFGPAYFASIGFLPTWIVNILNDYVYLVAYSFIGQLLSVGEMWRDPNHLDVFLKHDNFLPKYTEYATAEMKENFLKLEQAVFCVGSGKPYDGGIEPWQTGAWGSVVDGEMRNMTERDFYLNDTFGLKTLDESGRLELTIIPNISHGDWTGDKDVINTYVLPWCT